MTSKIYYIYHIPGYRWKNGRIGKIGCTEKDVRSRVRVQGYTDFEVLETHTDIYVASDREQELQRQYGYPVDNKPYWQQVATFTKPEVLAKQSAAKTGKKLGPQSQEHKDKRSAALKGKKHTPERIANRSAALIGRIVTEETRAKISAAQKGVPKSEETRANISAAQKLSWERRRQQKQLGNTNI